MFDEGTLRNYVKRYREGEIKRLLSDSFIGGQRKLFQTSPQNITQHIKAIYEEGEANDGATCKQCLQVRQEGERQVQRAITIYRLDIILAVGYRVRSIRGTQFRR